MEHGINITKNNKNRLKKVVREEPYRITNNGATEQRGQNQQKFRQRTAEGAERELVTLVGSHSGGIIYMLHKMHNVYGCI